MLTWVEPDSVEIPAGLQEAVGGHPLAAEILARRGILDARSARAFLDPNQYTPAPPQALPGMEEACQRIERAIQAGQRVWVWGDFDVDGQTSTALLVSVLRELGGDPAFHIPVRAQESHGVNIPHLKKIIASGADLLLTCDTGITAHEALDYAQKECLDVIVTDHHTLGAQLPPALACLTPRLLPEGHPLGTLPGVGVAFKLAEALLARARKSELADALLDLVALGIVADVALLSGDARFLLQKGLDALRRTRRAGLRAMFEQAELQPAFLTEEHIGFALAPRLNALGRLDDANPAVELFTTADPARARVLAIELEALNARRQLLTRQVLDSSLKQVERDASLLEPPVLILSHPEWPAGVIGIVASQLAERFQRPVVMLAAPPEGVLRGSVRSVEGIDITACITTQAGLLEGFGGHPMAAGLSLRAENLPAFKRGLARAVQESLLKSGGLPPQTLRVDAWLDLEEASLELVSDLERLSPFGAGNPALVFAARGLSLASSTSIGRGGDHLQMIVEDRSGQTRKVLWWGGSGWPQPEARFDLAYTLRASNYRGQHEVQVEWLDFRPILEPELELRAVAREIVDHRTASHPRPVLDQLRANEGMLIWAEEEARDLVKGTDRSLLEPAQVLVIWTTPPGRAELDAALERVRPSKVVLFCIDPGAGTLEGFLKRLAGLTKYLISSSGGMVTVPWSKLAGACAQRESAVRLGITWLETRGLLRVEAQDERSVGFTGGANQPAGDDAPLLAKIRAILDETAAYRRYFKTAPKDSLL